MFSHSVVIAGDNTGTDVHILTYGCIAQISKMLRFRASAQRRFLDFHKITDLDAIPEHSVRPEARKRSQCHFHSEVAVVENTILQYRRARTDPRVGNAGEGTDRHILADDRISIDLYRRINDRIGPDLDVLIDEGALRIENRNALRHERFAFPAPHEAIDR